MFGATHALTPEKKYITPALMESLEESSSNVEREVSVGQVFAAEGSPNIMGVRSGHGFLASISPSRSKEGTATREAKKMLRTSRRSRCTPDRSARRRPLPRMRHVVGSERRGRQGGGRGARCRDSRVNP